MQVAADTAAVMVTHDGEGFLRRQCESILLGSVLPAVLIAVDDASQDGSREILMDVARSSPIPVELITVDSSAIRNGRSRIARNVIMGLAAAEEYRFVVLSDQDDDWLPDRLARQRSLLLSDQTAMLIAGDGILIDQSGEETGCLLSDSFPRPSDWDSLDAAGRVRAVLRAPFVTGAASALTMTLARLMQPVPSGWLHDRWATLVAVACNGLVLQDEAVIRYRIHPGQALGERQVGMGRGQRRWRQVLERGGGPLEAAGRARDVIRRVGPLAGDPDVRRELSWRAVLASAFDRS